MMKTKKKLILVTKILIKEK